MTELPLVLIMAAGRGDRMRLATGGAPKGLLPLDSSTTVMSNLVTACKRARLEPRIVATPMNHAMRAFAGDAYREVARPSGYLNNLLEAAEGVGDVIAIDYDTVARPEDLDRALEALLASEAESTLCVVAAPRTLDPRAIRPVVDDGRHVGLATSLRVPNTAGIYRFRSGALCAMAEHLATEGATFHTYMRASAEQRKQMQLHVVPRSYNLNTPADYEDALGWWSAGTGARSGASIGAAKVPA